MRNIFLFIRRYAIFILFLILQITALTMFFSYNRFHSTLYGMFASEVSGRLNDRVDNVYAYFSLKEQNNALRIQNAQLLSQLRTGQLNADTTQRLVKDTIRIDSSTAYRQYEYLDARVISNSVFLQQNYMMLHRGADQGVQSNMAVVGPEGVIGTVIGVSKNMSTVMSLLHRQSKLIAVLKKGSGLGEIVWDGKDPQTLLLNKIPKTIVVKVGDTVVTSPYSDRFPPGMNIGFVSAVTNDQETNTYILKVRPAIDFSNIRHAYVVKNKLQGEMDELKSKLNKE